MTDSQLYTARNIALTAGIICLLVFMRALSCDLVNFDDQESILENSVIRNLDTSMILGSFSTSMFGFWMPLTWISYAVDYHFWGLNPLGYHLTNILLHALNTGLVVLIADNVLKGVRGSLFEVRCSVNTEPETQSAELGWLYPATLLLAGLLWGIHPLRVESVVWVTERKDVLNGVFALLSVLAYFHYSALREAARSWLAAYLLCVALFACSLMAKPVTVVLPLMLLVLDWYPLGRLRRGTVLPLLFEKLPFLLLSLGLSLLTLVMAAEKKLLMTVDRLSIVDRFLVAGNALFEYLKLLVMPVGILPLHPLVDPIPAGYVTTSIVSLLVLCSCAYYVRSQAAVPAVALLFLLPLLPVLGFLQNGQQAFAARYTYLPHIAVSILAATLLARYYLLSSSRRRNVAIGLATVLVVLAGMTQRQIGVWKNSGTLWSRVIEHHPVSTAYKSRGTYYLFTGRYAEAVEDYNRAMETSVWQEKLELYNLLAGRAVALGSLGRFEESIRDFTAAITLYPHPSYYYNRGITFEAMGRMPEAQADLLRAGPDPGPIKWFVYDKALPQ